MRSAWKESFTSNIFGFLATGLIFLSASSRASELPEAEIPEAEIPFLLHDHFIVVKGSIESMDNLNLVIDTGASSTTVSREIGEKLDLKGKKKYAMAYGSRIQLQSVTLSRLTLGSLAFFDVPASVLQAPLGHMRRSLRIDVLIGLDLLKQTSLTIDFESRTLRFGPIVHAADYVPIYLGLPFVSIRLEAGGKPLHLQLDTAARDIILFAHRVEGRLRMKQTWERKGILSSSGNSVLEKVYIPDVTLGTFHWEKIEAFILRERPRDDGLDGVLGPTALDLKRLHLDFQQGRISWERN